MYSMSQERFSNLSLSLLNIENDLTDQLTTEDMI
jgi:hypothetical protein